MPIYEYACQQCGKEFEELVTNEIAPACPYCGAKETKKLMSCCAHSSGDGGYSGDYSASASSGGGGGGCCGCSGGNCASCGH